MSQPDDISVIVCAYTLDRWDDMVAAIESIRRQSLQPREIIVVIDHNPILLGRTRAEIAGVVVVENREARGLSGARNSGIRSAQGSVIAFIDEDAVADFDWLERLSAGYVDARVLGVGGVIEPMWLSGRPGWFPPEFDWVVGCTYRGMPTQPAQVRNMIGCNMSFRREIFAMIGGFRNGIGRVGTRPVGCEETELCIRTCQHWPDGILLYEPRARVRHRVPAQRSSWAYFRARCYAEGISKALVSQLVGAGDGLESERIYTLRTLPRGVLGGLAALLRGDLSGGARAGAIVSGLAVTSAGYVAGAVSRWISPGEATRVTKRSAPPRSSGS
ncbi:MAG TPA: glycosyltransferase family 2 protein [Roseiflexaceae bacterium]|nr:glycosyltransferase family 2 protein [Roseiflexaceae bacterium]